MATYISSDQVCAMYRYYHQPCMIFDPPIVFGARHCYNTRCKDSFVNLLTCRLTTTKRYFRSSASSWWNSLIATVPVDCTYTSFVSLVRNYYYNDCTVLCN